LILLTVREDLQWSDPSARKNLGPWLLRLAGGWRRVCPVAITAAFGHQNRPEWCHFIPAPTSHWAYRPNRHGFQFDCDFENAVLQAIVD
jgi:hypothetical protein